MKRDKHVSWLALLPAIVVVLSLGLLAGRFAVRNVRPLQAQSDQPTGVDIPALLQEQTGQAIQPIGVELPLLESNYGMAFVPVDPAQAGGAIISVEEALAVAHQQKPKTKGASSFTTDLGVLSNASESGQWHSVLQEPRLVWFISFEGVATYSSCEPVNGVCPATYVTYEYSVVVDAVTGEWVIGLTM